MPDARTPDVEETMTEHEDLIARLRNRSGVQTADVNERVALMDEAADVLEKVTAERDAAYAVVEKARVYLTEERWDSPAFDPVAVLSAAPAEALREVKARARAEALREAIQAHRDLHTTYGSTTACRGGVGGQVLTPHCAVICDNPAHNEAKEAWRQIEKSYFEETDR